MSFLVSAPSTADDYYLVTDIGRAELANPDRIWHDFDITVDAGYESTKHERSPTWAVGIGKRYQWGAIEGVYQDFGDTKSYAGYPYDPGAPGSSPGGCAWPCTPTQWVYHYGYARGVTAKAIPEYGLTDDVALVFIAGVTAYYAKFEYTIANENGNPYAKGFGAQKDFSSVGLSAMWGGGLRIGDFLLKFESHESIRAKNSTENGKGSFQKAKSATVSVRKNIKWLK